MLTFKSIHIKPVVYAFLYFVFVSCKTTQVKLKTENINQFFEYKSDFKPLISVHRGGGEEPGIPENCFESFQYYAKKFPAIIECDLRLTKDSVLVFLHDETLDRTTTGYGKLNSYTFEEVNDLFLKDNSGKVTPYKIPKVEDVLKWGNGKVLFTLDVKKETPFERVVDMVKKTNSKNSVVVITYNVQDAKKVNQLDSQLMISVNARNEKEYDRLADAGVPDNRMVAFIGTREPNKEFNDFLHKKGIITILGTIGNLDKMAEAKNNKLYAKWVSEGADILSTDRPMEAYNAITNK